LGKGTVGVLKVKPPPSSGSKLKVKDKPQTAPHAAQKAQETTRLGPPALRSSRKQDSPPADVLPHSLEAEQGVLSSIMQDAQHGGRQVIADVSAKINENFFYHPAHKTIYEMLISLWRANRPLDLISFTEFLRHKNVLNDIGGAGFVTELHGYMHELTHFAPTAANVDYYVGIVMEKFARREIISDATQLRRAAYGVEEDFSVVVQRLTNRISHIGTATNGRFPQLQDTAEFFTRESPPLPPLIIHHCLHQGSKMLLGGNSKGRKTWALMDLAISVASGAMWWGFHTRQGPVCYINLEIQPQFFELRFKKICEVKQCQPEPGMLFHWPLRGYARPMDKLINDVLGFLQQHHFSLVIIDPIYKTLPPFRGSENDSAMITQLLNEVESITVETGAAVLFCSHFSKGDQTEKEPMDRVSGSGAWARDPDSLLTMTPHEEDECFTVEGVLRNLAPIHPFVVKWDYPLFMRHEELHPERLKKRGPKGTPPEKLYDALSEFTGLTPKEALKILRDQHGIERRTAYRLKTTLEERGLMKTEDGLWFKLKPDK
jgi:hypothetical protein